MVEAMGVEPISTLLIRRALITDHPASMEETNGIEPFFMGLQSTPCPAAISILTGVTSAPIFPALHCDGIPNIPVKT